MSTAVASAFIPTGTSTSNQRKVDRCQNGVLWAFPLTSTEASARVCSPAYSLDNGATWVTNTGNVPFNGSGSGTLSYTPNHSMFIDLDDFAHLVFKDQGDGFIYYRRGTPNAARTTWTWSAALRISLAATDVNHPDVIAHREGTGWVAHAVFGRQASVQSVYHVRVDISSGGALSTATTSLAAINGTADRYPSIDFNHTGDGKTVAGGTPHLYVAWSAGFTGSASNLGIQFNKAVYSGGTWTWRLPVKIEDRTIRNNDFLNCLFDGTRVILTGAWWSGANLALVAYDRDAADTATTTRVLALVTCTTGTSTYTAIGDIHFIYRGASDLVKRKWTRSSGVLGDEVVVEAGAPTQPYPTAKRGYSATRLEFIYTLGTASPYSIRYDAISLNAAPNAPVQTAPVNGTRINRANLNRLAWNFSDPDVGDTQSAADVRYRTVGSATWTTVAVNSPNQFLDVAAGTFSAADFEWQVRTYDAAGVVGPYSGSGFFTAADAPTVPTIQDPINGQTVTSNPYVVRWSAAAQTAYRVRTVADNAGVPNTAVIYTDTGLLTGVERERSVAFPVTGRTEHVQVQISDRGLLSPWASVSAPVAYTPPATPTGIVAIDVPNLAASVLIGSPAPVGAEPAVASYFLERRDAAGVVGRLATNLPAGVYLDRTLGGNGPLGTTYQYRVTATGVTGTSTAGAWTS